MVRCNCIIRGGPSGVQCGNTPPAAKSHYGMVMDPLERVPHGHTIWLCTTCDVRLVAPLVAEENELTLRMKRRSDAARALNAKGHEYYQQRKALWEEVRRLKEAKTNVRNRWCRACGEALKGCKDPYYQRGDAFAHVDLHSPGGFGRAWLMFHTECLRRWLLVTVRLPDGIEKRLTGRFGLAYGQRYLEQTE